MTAPIDIREEAGVRTLHFGSDWIQGAMRIARPWHLELDYTKEMMASLLLREDSRFPRKALLIGLGAASLTKFLYRHFPLTKLTVVEIEPAVVHAARQFFKLPEDPQRLNIVIADGVEFMAGNDKSWDLILVDGFDADASAGALDSEAFYLAVNLLGNSRGHKASLARLNDAFDGRSIAFPSCDSGNVIAFAAAGDTVHVALDDMKDHALALKQETGLNLLPTLTRLAAAKTCRGGVLEI
jgi:spermidine synthase